MIFYALLSALFCERYLRPRSGKMRLGMPFLDQAPPILLWKACAFRGRRKKGDSAQSWMRCFSDRAPIRGFFGLLGVFVFLSFLMMPLSSGAEEKTLLFSSSVKVHEDSSLEVREEITVNIEGQKILHGIFRDFPTQYRDSTGRMVSIGFSVKGALLNGRAIPYKVDSRSNGVRVYLGDPNRRAPPGQQTYTFVYGVSGVLGFFDEHDELYWNVTGNDWSFSIDEARFSLSLPGGAAYTAVEFFTGWRGAHRRDAELLPDGSVATTEPLLPGEGFTVVYAWPKGIVSPPEEPFLLRFFARYHIHFLVALPLLLLLVYILLWLRWGKDPPMPVVIPLFSPSSGRTPGFLRYVSRMGMDDACFTAEVLNLAVKGYITIKKQEPEEDSEKAIYSLQRTQKPSPHVPGAEKLLLTALFTGEREDVAIKPENSGILGDAQERLTKLFKKNAEGFFFKNSGVWLSGLLVPVSGLLLMGAGGQAEIAVVSAFLTAAFAVACSLSASDIIASGKFRRYQGSDLAAFILRRFIPDFLTNLLILVVAGIVFLAVILGALFFSGLWVVVLVFFKLCAWIFSLLALAPLYVPLLSFVTAVVIVVFHELMTIRTPEGNRVLAEAEGLILYMGTAERRRLEMLNPPEETPEVFEILFPYAFALGVAETWAERFDSILSEQGYAPDWYEGGGSLAYFYRSTGFSAVLSSSVLGSPEPGSSSASHLSSTGSWFSGFGGGGFSGGGRGGGGGGGW